MNILPNAKARVLVGLALHQDRFSMVKLKRLKQATIIDDFALLNAPEGWLIDGKTSQTEEIISAVRALAVSIKAENCRVAIGLPASQIIQKRIKVAAYLNDAEREAHITENLTDYFPGLNESLNFDYIRVEAHEQDDEFLLVAARRVQVDAYVALLDRAGLKTSVVDVDIFALARALSLTVRDDVTVILDVDAAVAQLILLERQEIKSVHQIHMNAEDEHFIQQLKKGLHLFSAMIHSSKITKIMLVGKQQRLMNIRKILVEELSIQIETSRITDHLVLSEPIKHKEYLFHEPELLTAIGLALRECPRW